MARKGLGGSAERRYVVATYTFVPSGAASRSGHSTAMYDPPSQQLTLTNHSTTTQDHLSVPPLASLFSLPPTRSHTLLIGITKDSSIVQIHVPSGSPERNSLILYSNTVLPLPTSPRLVLPVDTMAWSAHSFSAQNDVLVSISSDGELAFWIPEAESPSTPEGDRGKWRCTGSVHTGRKDIRMARCSSAKKTVVGTVELYLWFRVAGSYFH